MEARLSMMLGRITLIVACGLFAYHAGTAWGAQFVF